MPKRARREVAPAEEEHKKVQFESTGNERLLFGGDGKCKRWTSGIKRKKFEADASQTSEKSLRQQINEGLEKVNLCIGFDGPSKESEGLEKVDLCIGFDGPSKEMRNLDHAATVGERNWGKALDHAELSWRA